MKQIFSIRNFTIAALLIFLSLQTTQQNQSRIRVLQLSLPLITLNPVSSPSITPDPVQVQQAIDFKAALAAVAVSLNTPVLAVFQALSAHQSQQQTSEEFYVTATAAAALANGNLAIANSNLARFQVAAQIMDSCLNQANVAEVKAYAAAVFPLTLQKSNDNLDAANVLKDLTALTAQFLVSNALRAAFESTLAQTEATADAFNPLKQFKLAVSNFDLAAATLAASWADTLVTFVGTSRQAAFAATATINTGNALAAKSGAINAASKAMHATVAFDYSLQVSISLVAKAQAAADKANLIASIAILDASNFLAAINSAV